jgi:hypothetical protein
VTVRDLPPASEAALDRWFDRTRWKFGAAEWFTAGEAHLRRGDLELAHSLLREGVLGEIARTDAAERKHARELLALRLAIAKPPLWAQVAAKPIEPAVRRNPPRPTPPPARRRPAPAPVQVIAPCEPDFTPRERLAAFATLLFGTIWGWNWILGATALGMAAIILGYGHWVPIAVLDLFFAGLMLLYPVTLAFLAFALIGHPLVALIGGEPLDLSGLANALVVLALILVATFGLRVLAAVIVRLMALAGMMGALVVVLGFLAPVFAPLSMPLAAVSVGGILGAIFVTWVLLEVLRHVVIPALDKLEWVFDVPSRGSTLTKRVTRLARERRSARTRTTAI